MKQLFTYILGIMFGLPLVAQETVLLETDFTTGIPADFVLFCNDQIPVKGQNFRNITPQMEWFGGKVNSEDGYAAFSTSNRTFELPTDNWLITPQLSIPAEGAWLKWSAKSIHYYLRDGYKVLVSTQGNSITDFTEIYSVEEETYQWNHHLLSLADYAGKDIYIAFLHDSQDKYLLALDYLMVGLPVDVDIKTDNHTKHFVGNVGVASVDGVVCNHGKDFMLAELVCSTTDGWSDAQVAEALLTGDKIAYHFDMPVSVGKVSNYTLEAVSTTGERVTLLQDSVICSHFERTLFVEKATGTWCNGCPSVIPTIQNLEDRYEREIVVVEAHINDALSYQPYSNGFKSIVNLPTILYNRDFNNYQYSAFDTTQLQKAVLEETIAKIDMSLEYDGDSTIALSSKVMFAADTDNSSDKYRVGYVIIEKKVPSTTEMRQYSGVASSTLYNEYYYIPTGYVSPELMFFANVPRGTESAFIGVKNSLPVSIQGGVEYIHETTLTIPNTVVNKDEVAIIALALNYYTDDVLNAVEVKLPADNSSSVCWKDSETVSEPLVQILDGTCSIYSVNNAPFIVDLLSANGISLKTFEGVGAMTFATEAWQGGFYLLRIKQGVNVWTKKIIL